MKKKKPNITSYRQRSEVANSDISNYLISPELYLASRNGSYRKFEWPAMKDGTIAHCEILRPELFWETYYLQVDTLHPKQKEFVDNILAAKDKYVKITPAIVEQVYTEVYTKPKAGDGMILYTKLESHIKGLYQGKEPITMAMRMMAEKRRDLLRANEEASALLARANVREEEVYYEFEGVKCKAQIDANGIDEEKKEILIVDLKIGKDPIEERELISKIKLYDYPRQLRNYEHALRLSPAMRELYPDIDEYVAERYIIHIDPVVCRVFKISDETACERDATIKGALAGIKELELNGLKKREVIKI